jgi:hypothetical protein
MQRKHWNPLTQREAERTERAIVNAQGLRERAALEGANTEFKARELPQITRRFEEQRDARATWEARYAKLSDAALAVENGLGMFGAAHADLTAMEHAGVSWRELDQEMGARECVHVEALHAQIAAAKGTLTREVSVTAMRWELEPIARGEVHGYEEEERKAAFGILKQLKEVDQNARMCVSRDTHLVLQEPENVHEQVRERIAHEANKQTLRLSQGMSMGRGM